MASKIELGSVGAVVQPSGDGGFVDAAVQLEQLAPYGVDALERALERER